MQSILCSNSNSGCSRRWPWTANLSASVSHVLELQAHTTYHSCLISNLSVLCSVLCRDTANDSYVFVFYLSIQSTLQFAPTGKVFLGCWGWMEWTGSPAHLELPWCHHWDQSSIRIGDYVFCLWMKHPRKVFLRLRWSSSPCIHVFAWPLLLLDKHSFQTV